MFLGFDDSLKVLKKEFKDAGVDMSVVRLWQKNYDKVRQQAPILETQYKTAKQELEIVFSLIKNMELKLIEGSANRENLNIFSKEMKKYLGHFNQEFLIGKEDTDFQTTYASIIKLCDKDMSVKGNALILQSEIENLIAVTQEALEKEWPDFKALAFFYIQRTDKEITELPHHDKVTKVENIYKEEFVKPLENTLKDRMTDIRIREIMEEELWN